MTRSSVRKDSWGLGQKEKREAIYCARTIAMLNRFLRLLIRCLLWLRYRIRVRGLNRIAPPDGRGVLFLANHPALIDPIMVMAVRRRL